MQRVFYRIHTEDRHNLPAIVTFYFDCFAIWHGVGYWCGVGENAACIDIIGTEEDHEKVQQLAKFIKTANAQEAVYVTATPTTLFDIREEKHQ